MIKETARSTETIPHSILEIRESACGRYSIFTNLRCKFTAEFPKEWDIIAYAKMFFGGLQLTANKPEDAADVNLNLSMIPMEKEMTLLQVIQETKNAAIAMGVTDITTGSLEVRGRTWHILSMNNFINPKPGAKIKYYITQMAGVIFNVTFAYLQHRLKDYEDGVDHILQTIRPIE